MYPNVHIAEDVQIGAFVIIGEPPRGSDPGALETHIGEHSIIRSHTIVYAGNMIGMFFQSGHGVLLREKNRIGERVSIGTHSVIEHNVQIGNNVRIHSNVFIPEYSVLGDDCWIGPCVVFTNARYPRSLQVKGHLRGPYIGEGAKIGAGAVLLPAISVGRNALIGAGAVVTKDVPDGSVVVGNPAREINRISDIAAYKTDGESL
jgi:acetyltransferase-like isoleucine patch superfamily enzyme